MMIRAMTRLLCFCLCFVLVAALCATAFAAPGDTVLYPQRSFYDDYEEEDEEEDEEAPSEYTSSVAIMPDGVYALVNNEKLTRWQPGDEAPVTLFKLPEALDYYAALYEVDEEEPMDPAERAKIESSIHQLIAGDDGLYAMNMITYQLARVDDQGFTFLDTALDMPSMKMVDTDWASLRQIYDIFVYEGSLFLLLGSEDDMDWESRTLYRVGLDGSPRQEYPTATTIGSIAPYKAGQLLVVSPPDSGGYRLGVRPFTIESGEMGKAFKEDMFRSYYNPGSIAYDPAQDAVYYVDQSQIQRLDLATGEVMGLAFLTGGGSRGNGSSAGLLDGGFFALNQYEGVAIRNIDPAYKVERALRVSGGWEDEGYHKFLKARPEVPVLLLEDEYMGADDIAQAIQSGETEVDIFNIHSFADLPKLIAKGYAADLSGSDILTADVAGMYPQVQEELFDANGALCAYPIRIYTYPYLVNVTLFEEYFPGEALPETWEEFLNLYLRFVEEDVEDVAFLDYYVQRDSLVYTIMNQFSRQYELEGQPADFESPVLRAALSLVAMLPDEELNLYSEDSTGDDVSRMNDYYTRQNIFSSDSQMFLDPVKMADMVREVEVSASGGMMIREYSDRTAGAAEKPATEYKQVPGMVFEPGQTPAMQAQLTVLVVNPKSSNMALAIEYLEAMSETMDAEVRYALHPDLNEPARYSHYEQNVKNTEKYIKEMEDALPGMAEEEKQATEEYIAEMRARLEDDEKNDWQLSAAGIANYREMAPYMYLKRDSVFDISGEGGNQLYDLISQYTSGNLQMDAFLKELNGKARMIRQEAM